MNKRYDALTSALLLAILIFSGCSGTQKSALKNSPETVVAPVTEKPEPVVLTGWVNSNDLINKVPGYQEDYHAYQPNAMAVSEIRDCKEKIDITVVLGTWCSDTARELPRFLQALNQADNPAISVKYFGVNRGFRDNNETAKQLNVVAVPTFIVYQGEKELGRVVETPELSIEEDIALIIASLRK